MSCRWIECVGCYEQHYDGLGANTCSRECDKIVKNWRALEAGLASLADAIDWTISISRWLGVGESRHAVMAAGKLYNLAPHLFTHGANRIPTEEDR